MTTPRHQQLAGLDTSQKCWRLYAVNGLTQRAIATQLGISQSAVSRALVRAERIAVADLGRDVRTHRAQLLTAAKATLHESLTAWERSKDGTTRKRNGQVEGGRRGQNTERRAQVETTESFGDARYLTAAIKAMERIARLLGLDAPTKLEVTDAARPLADMPSDQLYLETAQLLVLAGVDIETLFSQARALPAARTARKSPDHSES